ncbi:hypothetical protein FXV77_06055 [Sphingobacterium phlebotomi]|uniref:Uncharacterized protein n=1 Tax=Sphingobacterium phlebotomi TaxID=2605433 RepID=A0A5D4HB56_9SPHI|nr:hypothetical protein [Sphingobacterium phlebotomi]TYR37562.1 hypothetical protein FXV77_06055 [Sphingobacterium phlebotomi]
MNKIAFIFAFLSIVLLSACGDSQGGDDLVITQDDLTIVISSSKEHPGLGRSDGIPAGTPIVLPEGVRIVERNHHPFNPDIRKLHAHANSFYVDVNLVNDKMPGTPPIIVEFPPGLVVTSIDHDKQNGLSIGKYLIPVPPTERIGGGRDTTTIYIGMACLNKDRSMPWYDNQGAEQRYPISRNNYQDFVVTNDANLLKLVDLLEDYPGLKITQHWDPVEAHEPGYEPPTWMKIHDHTQELIWKITDGHGITKGELDKLQKELKSYR